MSLFLAYETIPAKRMNPPRSTSILMLAGQGNRLLSAQGDCEYFAVYECGLLAATD